MLKNLFIFHRYKARIKGANVILFLRMIDSLGLLMEIQKNLFFLFLALIALFIKGPVQSSILLGVKR